MTAPDYTHGCADGGAADGVPVAQRKASSQCCGAKLAEGGTDENGHTCTQCGQPAVKVLGPKTAHWTCTCGQRRSQVLTEAVDDNG